MNWAKKLSRNVTAVFVVIIVLVSMFAFSLIDNLRAFADPSLSLSISANQGDQLVRRSGTGTAGGPALPTFVAGATVMLDDDFDRAESSEVGEGWVEVEGKGASVAIADHRLLFADTSDVVNRPLARRSFTEVSTGTLQWDFDFDWTRTGDESIYRVLMQLGDGGEMDDDSQDDGVGVNLVWSVIDGEHQTLGYGDGGDTSALTVLSGPAHISVVADLDTHTYSVWVDGALVKSGIPFDAEVPLNTVRYFTDQLNEDKFSGRTFDNVVIISESGGNNPPLADAGPDQGVGVGATVNLDGAGSTDADSDTLSYSWTLLTRPASSTASLTGADTASPSFVADLAGIYEVELVVSDGTDFSAPDMVSIAAGVTILLRDSFDRAESSEVGEGWVEVEGRKASVAIADNQLFFADTSDVVERPLVRRSFTEVATGTLWWDFDFDWTRTGDESIYRVMMQLGDGGEMDDDSPDDGVGVNLVWSVIGGEHQRLGYSENGALTSLEKVSGAAQISVTADLEGRAYSVSVDGKLVKGGIAFDAEVPLNTVRYLTDQLNEDHFSGRSFDNVVITSGPGGNRPPVADAGPDQMVGVGATVTLDGTGSTDEEGDPLSFSWTLTDPDLIDATASLTGADTASPSFVADLAGIYEVELVVSDGTDFSAPDTVSILVTDQPGNTAPQANAGPDQVVQVGATVTLDGSGSTDDDGDPLSFSWTLTDPDLIDATASLTGADTASPSFVADLAGIYEVELVVSDGTDFSAPDTVSIVAGTDACPGGAGDVSVLETAINEANLDSGLDVLTLANDCSYHLTAPLPDISSPISIEGDGSTIIGNATFRILLVERLGELTLNDLDLTNGAATTGGGGAILNAGSVILNGTSSIFGNTATSSSGGGGIRNNGGTVTLNGASSIFGNTATSSSNNSGGGIFNNDGRVTLNDASSIHDNTAASGGGIRNNGTVTLNDTSSIFGNIATGSSGGGGIRMGEGEVTLNDASRIFGNTANGTNSGGGIRVDGGVLTLNGSSSISENIPDDITLE